MNKGENTMIEYMKFLELESELRSLKIYKRDIEKAYTVYVCCNIIFQLTTLFLYLFDVINNTLNWALWGVSMVWIPVWGIKYLVTRDIDKQRHALIIAKIQAREKDVKEKNTENKED